MLADPVKVKEERRNFYWPAIVWLTTLLQIVQDNAGKVQKEDTQPIIHDVQDRTLE